MATISYWLDQRRKKKKDDTYPLKLQVYHNGKRKRYNTPYSFTEEDYSRIMGVRPRGDYKLIRNEILQKLNNTRIIADSLNPFSFEIFEERVKRPNGAGTLLYYHFDTVMAELLKNDKISTYNTYKYTKKKIQEFLEFEKRITFEQLSFYDIDKKWLHRFQNYLSKTKGLSFTTVKIYTENIRALFNRAIDYKEIKKDDSYPFGGKRGYKIPKTKKVKKALNLEDLGILFHSEPKTVEQKVAKDFWFFSYACNGMNLKDMANLKFSNLEDESFHFIRAKTSTTSDVIEPIKIYLNKYSKEFIKKYSKPKSTSDDFVFQIYDHAMNSEEKHRALRNFNRFINQHIKKLAKDNELPTGISFYWARHSFATNSIRNGASMEFLQEALGHKNINTTNNYFSGFESEIKKEFAKKIMDF